MSYKYYCGKLDAASLRWEIGAVRDRLLKEPDSVEYRERLNELFDMDSPSAAPSEPSPCTRDAEVKP